MEGIEKVIDMAVARAIAAAEEMVRQKHGNYAKEVERLLYARKGIGYRIEVLQEELAAMETDGLPPYNETQLPIPSSNDADGADTLAGLRTAKRRELHKNCMTARRIDRAVHTLADDPYYGILRLKYFEGLPEEEVAYQMHCDPSTVRRNKNRLIQRLAVLLYGAAAVV